MLPAMEKSQIEILNWNLRKASHVETNKSQRGVCDSHHAQEGREYEEWED